MPTSDARPEPLRSLADVKALSGDQVNARWPEVARALAGLPPLPGPDADLSRSTNAELGELARHETTWPLVQLELTRRAKAAAEARKQVRADLEAKLAREEAPRPLVGPGSLDPGLGR